MLLIAVRVKPSAIHGLGLFTVDRIPRGTAIWRIAPGFDQEIGPESFAALPEVTQSHVRWFAWKHRQTGRWILSGDHACFMNHDPQPNTGLPSGDSGEVTRALRDLLPGEELTCDYREFDAEVAAKLS